MSDYTLHGKYALHGRQGVFEGVLSPDANGNFQTNVIDHGATLPHQPVKGFVRSNSEGTLLLFLKTPPDAHLAQILYAVQKESQGISGTYTGFWYAFPKSFPINLEHAAQLALRFSLEDLPHTFTDDARVTLCERISSPRRT